MFLFRPPLRPHHGQRTLPFLLLICVLAALPASGQTSHKSSKASPAPAASPQASASPSSTVALPDPVATLDGVPLHRDDLVRIANVLLANQGRSLQTLNDEDKKRVYASVLDDMITDRLVNRAAANETVDPLAVEKRFNELRAQYPSPDAFDAEIKKSGQSSDQVRANLRVQLAQQQWIESQIADQTKVTPEEVEKFYKEGPPSKFDAPEMIRASHILIAARSDAPPEDVLTAEKKADDLSARLKKGESFEELAKANSDDPNAKQTGGDLDYFSRERIMPEFADAAFKLKVGEVSAPVRTKFGFHIIKLTDRKPAHTATLNEARDQIISYLQGEKRRVAVAQLIESLKAQAKIENFVKT